MEELYRELVTKFRIVPKSAASVHYKSSPFGRADPRAEPHLTGISEYIGVY